MGVLTNHLGSITRIKGHSLSVYPTVEAGGLHGDEVSAVIQRHMVVKRETIGAQATQPAILDSQSVMRKRWCQPVSWKVHGGQKMGEAKTSSPYPLPPTKVFQFR